MNRSYARPGLSLLLMSLYFFSAAPAQAQNRPAAPAVAEVALDQSEGRLQRLIAGAKKEGELTVYGTMTVEDKQAFTDAFSKKYGIKVKTWRSGSEALVQKVVNEARAGRFEADILDANDSSLEALHRENLMQRVNSPYHRDLRPEAVPAHKEWAGAELQVFVQAYNTDKIRKEDLPKTWADLLDPKWKGRLGIENADEGWFATLLQDLGHEKGMTLFKKVVDTNGISVRKGHSLLAQLVASGEVPLGLTIYGYSTPGMKKKGAPIESFVIAPAIAQFSAIGLLRHSPNPHAAMLFYDFMLSEEGQRIFIERSRFPASTKIDTPWSKTPIKFIDSAQSLDQGSKWVRDFEESVTKRAKQ